MSEKEKKTELAGIRMEPSLYKKVATQAMAEERSFSYIVCKILAAHYKGKK